MTTKKPDAPEKKATSSAAVSETAPEAAPAAAAAPEAPPTDANNGNGNQTTALAPRDAYLEAFNQVKDVALVKLTDIAGRYEGEAQEQIRSLLRSVNPVKEGLEEMAKGFQIPTVWILQPTSKQRPEGCNVGDLYTNSGSKVDRPLRFVPLYGFEMNRMFPQNGTLGRPVCTAPDGKLGNLFGKCADCQYLPMGKNNTGDKTDCDNVLVFIVLTQQLRLMRLEFAKTSRKAGSRVNQLASEGDAIWDRWLALDTAVQRNEKGPDFNIFAVSSGNQPTPSHIREAASALYQMLKGERTAFLHQHWQTTMKRGTQASSTDENVDLIGLGITGNAGCDNPDVTKGF